MILTVTLNAAIDKRYVVDDFKAGEVNRVRECSYVPGGKGLNVSKPASIYGAEVVATGFVGGHAGNYIEDALKPFGIKGEFYHVDAESRSCINIWDEVNHVQTEFLEPGFTLTEEDFRGFEKKFTELVKDADVVSMSGSVPKGLDGTAYQRLVKIVKEAGKPVILDTSGKLLEMGIEACPTLIKPNIDEIRMLTGKHCDDIQDIIDAAKTIHANGVEIVAVSLGADGSLAVGEEGIFRAIVPKIDAVNTVGCGDSMIAGFALGLSEDLSLEETLRRASAISAAAAMREETGFFVMEDMEKLLPQIVIQKLYNTILEETKMAEFIDPEIVPKVTLPSGEKVPCMGMGTFGSDRVSAEDVSAAVAGAIRSGYRMFDCAACYGNEHQIGEVFKTAFDEGVVERKDLFIMTKVWNDMHRKVEEACTKSIQDLQCDYVDLYFIHWPFPNYHAPFCDVDSRNPDSRPFSVEEFMDTYRQCEELVEKGKIRYIGISNMTIPKLEAVLPLMKIKPAACELELHPCFQQQEQYDYLVAHNIQPVGYMPLGSPRRPERDICPEDVADMQTPEMQEIAKAHGVHPALIALKWAHQRGEISIPFSVHNYVSNLKCVTEDPLTEEEMAKIGTLERGNRLVKGQVFLWEGAKDWHDLWDEEGFIVK